MNAINQLNFTEYSEFFEDEHNLYTMTDIPSGKQFVSLIRNSQFDKRTVLLLICQLLSALSALSDLQIVFKDNRPGNIDINSEGNFKLGDFGIAKILEIEENLEKMTEYAGDFAPQSS